jgi:hypothetical protein
MYVKPDDKNNNINCGSINDPDPHCDAEGTFELHYELTDEHGSCVIDAIAPLKVEIRGRYDKAGSVLIFSDFFEVLDEQLHYIQCCDGLCYEISGLPPGEPELPLTDDEWYMCYEIGCSSEIPFEYTGGNITASGFESWSVL